VFPQGGHHAGGGANALLQHLAGMAGVGGAGGWNPLNMGPPRAPPRAYDAYMKAYSVAMLPGRERENLSYGGKSRSRGTKFVIEC
jgi:ubiquitin fusion degradation protein 1